MKMIKTKSSIITIIKEFDSIKDIEYDIRINLTNKEVEENVFYMLYFLNSLLKS